MRQKRGWFLGCDEFMRIRVKRVYEPATPSDGYRVLVDRIWPRGLSKAKARVDLWLKEMAPSTELRKWFKHDPAKWAGFQTKYRRELRAHQAALSPLRERAKSEVVTLVFGARDEEHNNAVALKQYLEAS